MRAVVSSFVVSWMVLALCKRTLTQDPGCDFSSYVYPDRSYTVFSPNYPRSYTPGSTCRWRAVCPDNYRCRIRCDLQMPLTQECLQDRLLVSRSGDSGLIGSQAYCGTTTFTETSTKQRLSIGLLVSQDTNGGRFRCTLDAVPAVPEDNCSCGYKYTNRIVGGEETGVNEFPAMVGLLDSKIQQIKCGGVIISARHVLTAAHCVIGQNSRSLKVVVGEHNVDTDDSPRQELFVSAVVMHPGFKESSYDNDIAVLTTATKIIFSNRVGPICLPFKYTSNSFAGSKVEALGWGTTFYGGPKSPYLQKVTLDVISNQQCDGKVDFLSDRQMCTLTPDKDSCQDDSGGPLLYMDDSKGALFAVGLIAGGRGCATDTPALNTRVTSYLQWIVDNTPHAQYCIK